MPQYKRVQYGKLHKYGKYILSGSGGSGGSGSFGEHIRYRIKFRSSDGSISRTIVMCENRVSFKSDGHVQVRMKPNGGEWVQVQTESIKEEIANTRVRSIQSDGNKSEWVYSDRANLKQI